MVQFCDEIPAFVIPWIQQQKMFWVATAPLSQSGHVNLSPKGFEGTFHIMDQKTVWYEDMSGSGIETVSHVRENGRLTIMFCAFEGPPRIVRLFGTGIVHEFDTPEYNALIPLNKRQPGSRSVIMLHIHKASSSCGYSIPFYTFKSHRMRLHIMAAQKEGEDIKAETANGAQPLPEKGLKWYWKTKNTSSIDGLPGLQNAFCSTKLFDEKNFNKDWGKDDERLSTGLKWEGRRCLDPKVVMGFILGVVVSALWMNLVGSVGLKLKSW